MMIEEQQDAGEQQLGEQRHKLLKLQQPEGKH